jgi:hypothetical protein
VIGAVLAVVLYFALESGLISLNTGEDTKETYFYAALAFIAGFSERKARVLLGGATKMLGGGLDEPDEKAKSQPDKAAQGSTA